jgi:hypothetical protein
MVYATFNLYYRGGSARNLVEQRDSTVCNHFATCLRLHYAACKIGAYVNGKEYSFIH